VFDLLPLTPFTLVPWRKGGLGREAREKKKKKNSAAANLNCSSRSSSLFRFGLQLQTATAGCGRDGCILRWNLIEE